MNAGRWSTALAAFEDLREQWRLEKTDPTDGLPRLATILEERATLEGEAEIADAASIFLRSSPRLRLAASEGLLHALRHRVHPCQHRTGAVLVLAHAAVYEVVRRQLAGLEHRVSRVDPEGLFHALDEEAVAALVLQVNLSAHLDLLARLRLDPRCVTMPRLVFAKRAWASQCRALGATAVLGLPLHNDVGGSALATLLGQEHPLVRALGREALPGPRALVRVASDILASVREDGGTYCLVLVHPSGIDEARRSYGVSFGRTLLEESAAALRRVVGEMARVHLLDDETLAWISRADREALLVRLGSLTAGRKPIPTPDGGTWFNRLCVAGVEVGAVPLDRALKGARRMLALARDAGGGPVVIAPLEQQCRGRPRALLFEPDPVVAADLTRGLEQAGFEVTRRDQPLEVLEEGRAQSYALIVAAVDDPSAVKLVRGLRRANPEATVLAVTPDVGSARAALRHGADDIVPKPVDGPVLAARLRARRRESLTADRPKGR